MEALKETSRTEPQSKAAQHSPAFGGTFFLEANAVPRTTLERLAFAILHAHLQDLPIYRRADAVAEWWLRRDALSSSDDDIANMHFDRDTLRWRFENGNGKFSNGTCLEGARHQYYPWRSTVTTIKDGNSKKGRKKGELRAGAPTLVFDIKSPETCDTNGSLKRQNGHHSFQRVWVSWPDVGKHIAFDGSLLHGMAPELRLVRGKRRKGKGKGYADNQKRKGAKKQGIMEERLVMLVNIWLDGIVPWGVTTFPSSEIRRLSNVPIDIVLRSDGIKQRLINMSEYNGAREIVNIRAGSGGGVRMDVPVDWDNESMNDETHGTTTLELATVITVS